MLNLQTMKVELAMIFFCTVALFGSTTAPESSVQYLSDQEHWGERFNSPNAKLTYKEKGRLRSEGRTIVTYNLFALGLPKNKHYTLWLLNIGSKPRAVADAYLNERGNVVSVLADSKRQIAEDPIDLQTFGGKGEPIQVALISDEDHLRVFAEIVPFPLEKTVGPCHVTVIELSPRYEAVMIKIIGLRPREELIMDTQSENEAAQSTAKADDKGEHNSLVIPLVKGKSSGQARFSITTNSCNIGIEFPWGEGSYKIQ